VLHGAQVARAVVTQRGVLVQGIDQRGQLAMAGVLQQGGGVVEGVGDRVQQSGGAAAGLVVGEGGRLVEGVGKAGQVAGGAVVDHRGAVAQLVHVDAGPVEGLVVLVLLGIVVGVGDGQGVEGAAGVVGDRGGPVVAVGEDPRLLGAVARPGGGGPVG